jgi:hypothetical protein
METPDGLSTPMVSMRKNGDESEGLFAKASAQTKQNQEMAG